MQKFAFETVSFSNGGNDEPIQIENKQSPNDSKCHSDKWIVENREKGIRTGNEGHNGGKENSGANTHIFGLFAFGATFQQRFVGSRAEDEKLF